MVSVIYRTNGPRRRVSRLVRGTIMLPFSRILWSRAVRNRVGMLDPHTLSIPYELRQQYINYQKFAKINKGALSANYQKFAPPGLLISTSIVGPEISPLLRSYSAASAALTS